MYWGDYVRKTAHLSTLEHGAYLLLIAHYWNTGLPLPDDDEILRRITKTSTKQFKAMREVIHSFFTIEGGKLYHERLEGELRTSREVSTFKSSDAVLGDKNEEKQGNLDFPRGRSAHARPHPQPHSNNKPPSNTTTASEERGAAGSGFENDGRGKGGSSATWSIEPFLTDDDRAKARANAPDWDLYFLINVYNQGVEKRGIPDKPAKAFIAWCAKYTKGRAP